MNLNSMNKDFDFSVKLKASDTGSAVLIKQDGAYYLLTAAHVCENQAEKDAVTITSIDGTVYEYSNLNRVLSPSKNGADVCIMRLPEDVVITLTQNVKCATFDGSGYPCQIDGFPSVAIDKKIRIENGCTIAKESELGDELYVKLEETRSDGQEMEYVKGGFSGSGVFVDSNGEKYLIGMVYRVEEVSNMFIGWKMQKINEILKGAGWEEIPLISIELKQQIIDQYKALIENSNFVLDRIKNEINGSVQLPRTTIKDKIEAALAVNQIVIITGEAGIGKSALAKDVITTPKYSSVAIVGDDLDEKNERDILSHWNISDKLQDIFKSPIWGEGEKVLLVESAERMLNGNTDTAIVFIENLQKDIPNLKVVFTIRKNSLTLFRVDLLANGIHVSEKNIIEVGLLSDNELKTVENDIKSIKPFAASEKTREILRIPFYLNLACSMASTVDAEELKGSEFKDMLCRRIVSGKKHDAVEATRRINTLIDVARRTSATGMNVVKCEMNETVLSLYKDDVLTGNLDTGNLRPGHDILTDWGLYCHIEDCYQRYQTKAISLSEFYHNVDKNIASRNMFKQFIEAHISEKAPQMDTFISESFSLDLEDYFLDDLFYAILISDKGSSFLTSIKPVLLRNNSTLLWKMANALSYMFRKVDWEMKDFLLRSGMIGKDEKVRNSDFMPPTGIGWYTFVTFLYENRDAFWKLRSELIPLLLQCELVRIEQADAPNLKKYVFAIFADYMEQMLAGDVVAEKPNKEVVRLLFKWMDENPEKVKSWVEKAIVSDDYHYEVIKEFLLLHEGLEATRFIYTYPELYKDVVREEWLDEGGLVNDYYPMIHQASGVTTTYKCFFYANPDKAIRFLCELLNEDIEKKKAQRQDQLQQVKVKVDGKEIVLWGNDRTWREYRGRNYQSHVRESLLMTFEKWLMDSINNHLNKSPYALDENKLLGFFDIVYNRCLNISIWGVLASVATRFPMFVGIKAMPIYSCRDFILWDKTRQSSELTAPMINPHASKAVRKEVAESYNLPHRKKDLESVILTLSITKGFAEEFRKLVKSLKDSATTYLEKVSAGRMDISQYKVIEKTDEGYVLQGSPSDDIKEEAEQTEAANNAFNRIIETSNLSRKRYDESESQDTNEWREAYNIHKEQNGFLESKGLVAALGVKKHWDSLDKEERNWCRQTLLDETIKYVTSGQFQIDTEYSSDGLLYLLEKSPRDKEVIDMILYLIGTIGDNDSIFTRFEKTYKDRIWNSQKEIAEQILFIYLNDGDKNRDVVDKFAHVCKLLPTNINDEVIDEMAKAYCYQYFDRWVETDDDYYSRVSDMRIETFCAEYMIAMPSKRKTFIETWLATSKKTVARRGYFYENRISSVFNHFCYVATKDNKEKFWQLWELMFEWYKVNHTQDVLSALMLNFNILRPALLDNWEVMEGAGEHMNKLLRIMPREGVQYLSRLVCNIGFNILMPDCLRYIDKDLLRKSARERSFMRRWQNAIEDLYDDAKKRDAIRRDDELRAAYVEILNGLISNGSAIAYMIRDYYI